MRLVDHRVNRQADIDDCMADRIVAVACLFQPLLFLPPGVFTDPVDVRHVVGIFGVEKLPMDITRRADRSHAPTDEVFRWLDTGTHDSILDAGDFVATIEKRQSLKIACIEEVAYRMRLITKRQMEALIERTGDNTYRDYLKKVVQETDDEW